jgi:hypothetical protein
VRGTDPDDSLYPYDRWSVPRTRFLPCYPVMRRFGPRARHWSDDGRIKGIGFDQCHARYSSSRHRFSR